MTYARCKSAVKPQLHRAAFPYYVRCAIVPVMGNRDTYLAAWRRFRGLTQAQVLDRLAEFDDPLLPLTAASLSRLENNKQPYSQRILEALADVYDTDPGALLTHDPFKEGKVLDLLHRLPPRDLVQAEAMLEAMARVAEARSDYSPPDSPGDRLAQRKAG